MQIFNLRTLGLCLAVCRASLPTACGDGKGDDGSSDETGDGDGDGDGDCTPEDPMIGALDESSCEADANDYAPTVNGSADDMWPTCENDDGVYHPFEQPGSAARAEAFANILDIFEAGLEPDDFTVKRATRSAIGSPPRGNGRSFPPGPEAAQTVEERTRNLSLCRASVNERHAHRPRGRGARDAGEVRRAPIRRR